MFFESLAYAMAPAAGQQQGNPIMLLLPWIAIFAIMYFLLIRPQQKKAKEHKSMLGNLKKSDYVLTAGGIYGRIIGVEGDVLEIEIANGVNIKINRNFVSAQSNPKDASKKD